MWETFDWKREGGQKWGSRGCGEPFLINHSSTSLKRAFQPAEGTKGLIAGPTLGLIPERGHTFQSFLEPMSRRKKGRLGLEGLGWGGGGVWSGTRETPVLLHVLLSPRCGFTSVYPSPSVIKTSNKQLGIFTYERCMPRTANIFFYWAFSIMDNKFTQTFSPSKNMMKYKTGTLYHAIKKDKNSM